MPDTSSSRGAAVLASASLLSLVLGSVHAFSVFLEPLEMRYAASRSMVSLSYSLALVALTLAVLAGHRVYGRWPAHRLVATICVMASAGAVVAAFAPSLGVVWLGYSVLFGAANGLGYGFGLQIAAQANPGREGAAMGLVTAFYALGAAVSPLLFASAMGGGGLRAALLGLAAAMLLVLPVCTGLMVWARASFLSAPAGRVDRTADRRKVALLWLGYGAGVAAGLMSIGHAAAIAKELGFAGAPWVPPAIIALCNMVGSFAGGWLIDRLAPAKLLAGLPLVSAIALSLLALRVDGAAVLVCMGLVGFAYGAIIAAYPATVAKIFGTNDGPRIYGRVFTAWGGAGLFAPWLAGYLFDRTGGYAPALTTAAGLGAVSVLAAMLLFRGEDRRAGGRA